MFLDAVDAGQIVLRSNFDDMDMVMTKMFGRISQINTIVKEQYILEMQEVGLR